MESKDPETKEKKFTKFVYFLKNGTGPVFLIHSILSQLESCPAVSSPSLVSNLRQVLVKMCKSLLT